MDRGRAGVEVQVRPAEPEYLTTAAAAIDQSLPEADRHAGVAIGHVPEEASHLFGRPPPPSLGSNGPGSGHRRWVLRQLAPVDRELEGGLECLMECLDRPR